MLVLLYGMAEAIREHAEEAYPRECCGLLFGRRVDGGHMVLMRVERARNLAPEDVRDRYELDPQDRLRLEKQSWVFGQELIGFYHSHPDHDAYFSETDLARSEEVQWGQPWVDPTYTYLVVAVHEGQAGQLKGYQVVEGQSQELHLHGWGTDDPPEGEEPDPETAHSHEHEHPHEHPDPEQDTSTG